MASRTLRGPEIAYFTTEKELLSIVWSLQKFRTYLLGREIIIKTDHQALAFIKKSRLTGARITRWSLSIQEYNIKIEYVKGRDNKVADYLSRIQYSNIQEIEEKSRNVVIASLLVNTISKELSNKFKCLDKCQKEDENTSEIIQRLNKGDIKITNRYKISNGILMKKQQRDYSYVITREIAQKLIKEIHLMYGHIGQKKVFKMIQENFYIKNLKKLVDEEIRYCDACQRNKIGTTGNYAKAQFIQTNNPNDLLSVDFFGPLPTSTAGVKYIFVTIDAFSKWVKLYPIKRATTNIVLKKILEDYIPKYGKPKKIQCDHGTQFTSQKWIRTLKENDIQVTFSSIRHPQGNIVERVNRELGRFFRTFVSNKHTSWAKWVKVVENCMNETYHETIEYTPTEIHLNKKPERGWAKYLQPQENNHITYNEKLKLVRERIATKGKTRADRLNAKHTKHTNYDVEDLVLLKALNFSKSDEGRIDKFFALYEGPYKISRKVGEATYLLEDITTKQERGRFHGDNLRKYYVQTYTSPHPI